MPYSIKKSGGGYDVVTSDTGKVHGHFKTHGQATAQLRALYANANPAEGKAKGGEVKRSFNITKEEKHHFVAHNGHSEFKIAKHGLHPKKLEHFRKLCSGGKVKKYDNGGEVDSTPPGFEKEGPSMKSFKDPVIEPKAKSNTPTVDGPAERAKWWNNAPTVIAANGGEIQPMPAKRAVSNTALEHQTRLPKHVTPTSVTEQVKASNLTGHRLIANTPTHFHVQGPTGTFKVAKKGLGKATVKKIEQHFNCGGEVQAFAKGKEVKPQSNPADDYDINSEYSPAQWDAYLASPEGQTYLNQPASDNGADLPGVMPQVAASQPPPPTDYTPITAESAMQGFRPAPGVDYSSPDYPPPAPAASPEESLSERRRQAVKEGNFYDPDTGVMREDLRSERGMAPGLSFLAPVPPRTADLATQPQQPGMMSSHGAPTYDPEQTLFENRVRALMGAQAGQKPGQPGGGGGMPGGLDARLRMYEGEQQAKLRLQADLAQKAAKEHVLALQNLEAQRQSMVQDFQKIWGDWQQQAEQMKQDIANTKLDPKRIWAEADTGSKISAVVGLILGGIGGAITGKPNAALSVIENALDRDLKAQERQLGSKENILHMHMAKGMNLLQAKQLAQADLKDAVSIQLQLASQKWAGQQKSAELGALAAKLGQDATKTRQEVALGTMQGALIAQEIKNKDIQYRDAFLKYNVFRSAVEGLGLDKPGGLFGAGQQGPQGVMGSTNLTNKPWPANVPNNMPPAYSYDPRTQSFIPHRQASTYATFATNKESAAALPKFLEENGQLLNATAKAKAFFEAYKHGMIPKTYEKQFANNIIEEIKIAYNKANAEQNRLNQPEFHAVSAMLKNPGDLRIFTGPFQASLDGVMDSLWSKRQEMLKQHLMIGAPMLKSGAQIRAFNMVPGLKDMFGGEIMNLPGYE